MSEFKSGYVAIVGKPNAGKSTLLNNIFGQKLAIVSNKPQTTRSNTAGILTTDDYQIIFTDTPGMHKGKNKLDEYMDKTINKALEDVDIIVYMLDIKHTINEELINNLAKTESEIILILNKADTIKNSEVLEKIATISSTLDKNNLSNRVKEIVPFSATKDDAKLIINLLIKYLQIGPRFYDSDAITDVTERHLVSEIIREKALKNLDQEVPHGIAVEILRMQEKENITNIEANIYCERESHKGIIIGAGGMKLKTIGTQARQDIEIMLDHKVNLKLWVKVKSNWRDSENLLNSLGYIKKNS